MPSPALHPVAPTHAMDPRTLRQRVALSVCLLHFYGMDARQRRTIKRALERAGIPISEQTHTQSTPRQRQEKPSKVWLRALRIHGWFWKLLLALVTLSGIGLWQLWPRIGVDPYVSLDPHSPFAQQFYVQNNSVYSIDNVESRCMAVDVRAGHVSGSQFAVQNPFDRAGHLTPGAKTNVTCKLDVIFGLFGNPQPYQTLLIAIVTTYKAPIFSTQCNAATFKGEPAYGGTYVWTYAGADTCPHLPRN
jgi:hypothetical protein